jgi:hypothetical protein
MNSLCRQFAEQAFRHNQEDLQKLEHFLNNDGEVLYLYGKGAGKSVLIGFLSFRLALHLFDVTEQQFRKTIYPRDSVLILYMSTVRKLFELSYDELRVVLREKGCKLLLHAQLDTPPAAISNNNIPKIQFLGTHSSLKSVCIEGSRRENRLRYLYANELVESSIIPVQQCYRKNRKRKRDDVSLLLSKVDPVIAPLQNIILQYYQ